MASAVALAADGHESEAHGGDSLTTVLFLLTIVGGAYLLTHFVVERLQQRFLFRSGLEYVLLGIVLGPAAVEQVHPFSDLTALGPIFAFAAGWVGLLYGLELSLQEFTGRAPRLALTDAVVTGSLVTGAAYLFFTSGVAMPPPGPEESALGAVALGCTAAAGSSSAVDLLAHRYADAETHLLPMLRRTAKLGDAVASIAFGVMLAVFHPQTGGELSQAGAGDWMWWTVGLGLSLGLLFFFFIGKDEGENTIFLAMVGILMFASGAAFFLKVSALLVNLVLGAVLAQAPEVGPRISAQLSRTERPVSLMLLLFAGALWVPVDPIPAVVLTLGFIGLRLLGKVLAVFLATVGTPLRGDLFRGMVAQGDAAVAMAVSMQLFYDSDVIDLAYTAILAGVVVQELVSPRLLRGLLVDAGELRQDVSWTRS